MKTLIFSQYFWPQESRINDFVFSDSGTVQEECCIVNRFNVIMRNMARTMENIVLGYTYGLEKICR
jgi:UDP-N-acetylglucosamine 2-epimerase